MNSETTFKLNSVIFTPKYRFCSLIKKNGDYGAGVDGSIGKVPLNIDVWFKILS
jgi:hypothetical protein